MAPDEAPYRLLCSTRAIIDGGGAYVHGGGGVMCGIDIIGVV